MAGNICECIIEYGQCVYIYTRVCIVNLIGTVLWRNGDEYGDTSIFNRDSMAYNAERTSGQF